MICCYWFSLASVLKSDPSVFTVRAINIDLLKLVHEAAVNWENASLVGDHPFSCRKVAHGLKTMIAEIKVRGCDEKVRLLNNTKIVVLRFLIDCNQSFSQALFNLTMTSAPKYFSIERFPWTIHKTWIWGPGFQLVALSMIMMSSTIEHTWWSIPDPHLSLKYFWGEKF